MLGIGDRANIITKLKRNIRSWIMSHQHWHVHEAGKIADMLANADHLETPLKQSQQYLRP